ncbi:MAG: hypothetical protein ACI4VK_02995 [Candidatus Coproplasma sp.]
MPKNKNSRSFEIALSGIACAITVIFLLVGVLSLNGWLLGTGYCIGVIALMLPLSKKFYLGDFLAYLGACVLTVVLGAAAKFWNLVPFVMFFGLHPLVNCIQQSLSQKTKNPILRWLPWFIVKALWFDATLIVGYYLVYDGLLGGSLFPQQVYDAVNQYMVLFAFTLGTVIFAVYDFLVFKCQAAVNILIGKVKG